MPLCTVETSICMQPGAGAIGKTVTRHCVQLLLLRAVLQSDLGNPLSVLDLTINLIFMFDIWMNFHTAVLGE